MKYLRTHHLPFSQGASSDDKILPSIDHLIGKEVIYTEKLDGECTSLTRTKIHARSEDSSYHPSQSWIRSLHAQIAYKIPEDIQIVGENVYACHSIFYDQLSSFFYVFAAIDLKKKVFLSYGNIISLCNSLSLQYVPILDIQPFDPDFKLPEKSAFGKEIEGYVIRTPGEFLISDFQLNVAKWVRANHIRTDEFWKKNWKPNKLKGGNYD